MKNVAGGKAGGVGGCKSKNWMPESVVRTRAKGVTGKRGDLISSCSSIGWNIISTSPVI